VENFKRGENGVVSDLDEEQLVVERVEGNVEVLAVVSNAYPRGLLIVIFSFFGQISSRKGSKAG